MDVSSSMMIVEHNYGEYDRRRHHEHDAVEVSSWKRETTPILVTFAHIQYQTYSVETSPSMVRGRHYLD